MKLTYKVCIIAFLIIFGIIIADLFSESFMIEFDPPAGTSLFRRFIGELGAIGFVLFAFPLIIPRTYILRSIYVVIPFDLGYTVDVIIGDFGVCLIYCLLFQLICWIWRRIFIRI